MHDTVFAREIKTLVNKKIDELKKKTKLIAINVKLSPFSHVKPETLKEAFALEVRGTRLEEIPLVVKMSEIEIECNLCGKKFFITKPIFSCPQCNSAKLQIKQVPEYFVESIETEEQSSNEKVKS